MKVIKIGNRFSRFALILMLKDSVTLKSIDDTITYYNSSHLDNLFLLKDKLLKDSLKHKNIYYDIAIYDYENARYVY